MKKLLLLSLVIIILFFVYFSYKFSNTLSFTAPIRVDLPQKNDSTELKIEKLIISIKKDIYTAEYKSIKKTYKGLSLLVKELKKTDSLKPNQKIMIRAVEGTGHIRVVEAMVLLNKAGWENITLITSNTE